jgi:diguanylate cyclase (GGDEF)-like protein/PAS domain S-box-containing protein
VPPDEVVLADHAFRALFDYLDETVICADAEGAMRFISGNIRDLLGYDPESLLGRTVLDFIHPDDLQEVVDGLLRWGGRTGAPLGHQLRVRAADGAWREVRFDTQLGLDLGPLGTMVLTLYEPVGRSDEVRRLRHQLLVEDRLTRLAAIVLHAPTHRFDEALGEAMYELGSLDWVGRVSVWTVDPEDAGRVVKRAEWAAAGAGPRLGLARSVGLEVSPALLRLRAGTELHLDHTSVTSPPLRPHERDVFEALGLQSALGVPLLADDAFLGFLLLESATGDVAHDAVTTATARAAATFLAGAFQRHAAERRLAEQARTDRVTGLGNRWAFDEALQDALDEVGSGRRAGFGLALVDLDRFKLVNDALGHAAGDRLLQKVAARLSGAADNGTVLGRLGGDELLVLLAGSSSLAETRQRLDHLIQALQTPFEVAGHAMQVTASVGVVHVPDAEVGPGELLRRADVAMYRAKARGGHTVEVDQPGARADDGASLRREVELREALRLRHLEVHYQGEWDLRNGRLLGAEALVRWPHPTDGLLTAAQFVPLAEERGLITELGWLVLREACRTAAQWTVALGPEHFVLRVNVAADQLRGRDFAERVEATLFEAGFPPTALCLELTESTLLADPQGSAQLFAHLRKRGIGLAIDDFGTGYSSMLQLKQLPLTALKIDRSFVMGLPSTSIDRAVVRTAVQLADALGASVTAEGVETPAQVEALVDLGCTRAQGFLLGRPEPAADFDRRVVELLA